MAMQESLIQGHQFTIIKTLLFLVKEPPLFCTSLCAVRIFLWYRFPKTAGTQSGFLEGLPLMLYKITDLFLTCTTVI